MGTPVSNPKQSGQAKEPELASQPILTHEKSLTAKIAKGSEASDIVDQHLVALGTQLVTQLNVLFKTSRIHGRTNTALDQPVEAILTLVKTLAHDKGVVLRLQNDFLFLGEMHLKMVAQQMAVFTGVIDSLNAWRIGALSFGSALQSKDLREFAYQFVTLDPTTHSFADLVQRLKDQAVQGVDLEESRFVIIRRGGDRSAGDKSSGGKVNRQGKLMAKSGYAKAAETVGEMVQTVRSGQAPSFKQAKKAIQNIVDLMMDDEAVLLGLTTLRCHDQYTHNHSVNVAVLSLALGNRVGYPKAELADLGLAALFHDLGKSSIPAEVLNKPGEFTEDEWARMRMHPTEGVISLTKLRGITNLPGRMASAAFEHHMNYDFSGYPKITVPWKQSLTGRILMIADCYDAMTSSRVYRREPMSPEKVLKMMFAKSAQSFDPVLLKLFVNCVGIVPIGSLMLLDTNELAVALRPSRDRENAERPCVKVLTDADGKPIDGPEVDLTETNSAGAYTRSIVRMVDSAEYRFDTSRYFV